VEYIVIAILVAAVIASIAYPLFFAPRGEIAKTNNQLDVLAAQRDATYDAIRDLDFDFQLDKLSQSDHTVLREKYVGRAASVLKQIDAQSPKGKVTSADAQLESQVAQMRHKKTDGIEVKVARLRAAHKSTRLTCSQCGASFIVGDRYCSKCGNTLARVKS
jgi:hypothetical protein